MNNIYKAVITEIKRHMDTIKTFQYLKGKILKDISDVSGNTVYFKTASFNRCMAMLSGLVTMRGGRLKYELKNYYYFGDNQLCISYQFEKFCANFYCNEPDFALGKISNKKCKTVIAEYSEKTIVCEA